MPTELALLSDTVPTSELVASLGQRAHPGGVLMEYRSGAIRQFIDADGEGILSLFTSRPIEARREADTAAAGGVGSYRLWTSLAIPYGDPTTGRALADAIADAISGQIKDYA